MSMLARKFYTMKATPTLLQLADACDDRQLSKFLSGRWLFEVWVDRCVPWTPEEMARYFNRWMLKEHELPAPLRAQMEEASAAALWSAEDAGELWGRFEDLVKAVEG